jgi:acetamidase/formamidase
MYLKFFSVLVLVVFMAGAVSAAAYRDDKIVILHDKSIGTVKGEYYVPSTVENVRWGRLPNKNTKPVLTIPSGSTVTFDTVSHEGILEDQSKDPVKYYGQYGVASGDVLKDAITIAASNLPHDFDNDGPHIVTGPVYVQGAEPGDVLKVEVLELVPRVPYGVISNRHYKGALVGEFPEGTKRDPKATPAEPELYGNVSIFTPVERIGGIWYGIIKIDKEFHFPLSKKAIRNYATNLKTGKDIRFPISPFLGIMGVTPNTEESWSSVPPANIGGNIDINELGVGSTLYLPVEVPGANFYTGDPHFVQGDGEVALTALEGSLRGTVRLTVLKKGTLSIPKTNSDNLVNPFAETEKFWIPIGLSEDLDEAMKNCVRESISFLAKQFGIDRRLIYAYLSAATDYEVSQVVDKTKGIHALISKVDFKEFVTVEIKAGNEVFPVTVLNDTFYVPANIVTALGLKYSAKDSSLNIDLPTGAVKATVDSAKYTKRGENVYLNSPVILNGGIYMFPASALGELLGISVTWTTKNNKVTGTAIKL